MEEEALKWGMGRAKGDENEKEAAGGQEGGCEFGGSRFPRDVGRKVPAGPVLSPRQDDQPAVSNIKPTCTGSLSSTRNGKNGTDDRKNMPTFPSKRESNVYLTTRHNGIVYPHSAQGLKLRVVHATILFHGDLSLSNDVSRFHGNV
ncbi:hypothetical protein WN51_07559 [Melipona quadrifasciata]|uniref:Uncharacterized protein n=1 Tax=Melipona quadrifasciata TaxID=166423 RepID=A0A0N0BJ98_9HYME|nr:hypothetical protein WN51_07559 [Melipona quadrifasciata]